MFVKYLSEMLLSGSGAGLYVIESVEKRDNTILKWRDIRVDFNTDSI